MRDLPRRLLAWPAGNRTAGYRSPQTIRYSAMPSPVGPRWPWPPNRANRAQRARTRFEHHPTVPTRRLRQLSIHTWSTMKQPQLIEQLKALRLRGEAQAPEDSLGALSQKKLAPTW